MTSKVIKRTFDLFFSVMGIIVLLPLIIFVAVMIRIIMKGPVFFTQIRMGLEGKEFRLIKFRTMREDKRSEEALFDMRSNSRITPLGKILRKYKLDEIPQLLNVVIGDMSVVGPRPEVKSWTKVYPEKWSIVLSVKPGLTDNASIEFINEEELLFNSVDPELTYRDYILPRKLNLYIDYVENHSIKKDILIILRTIQTIFSK